ncbi:MAG TPA: ABC transporter permease [Spirochaetota bacterium]|nr:ABC transporter permease [Spirochaetota bacterium]HPF07863.1 ABC transporter permease [Spirochaetota bacterium]HPJ42205.1 ABC transporter permease [Spirochaetota bacterium]HPR37858.1 ABC transporter permease [Spirochaetota bacterium]HRX49318.1 ABC transporter permease [Spirochaetota bacterium]
MNFKNLLLTALRALTKNKLRSSLTSIGIIIGISSVIVMVGMGESAKIEVRGKVFTYGANALSVSTSRLRKYMNQGDLVELKNTFYQIELISPYLKDKNVIIRYRNMKMTTDIEGVGSSYFEIKGKKCKTGRLFQEEDIFGTSKVAVIGSKVQQELFKRKDPIGEQILVGDVPLTIIGVLEYSGESFGGRDFDSIVLMPYTTFNTRLLNRRVFEEIYIKAIDENSVHEVGDNVRKYLRAKFNILDGQPDNIKVYTSDDKLKMANDISNALAILLAGIASISLFVGGVGIMNIMLVSVTERTREIGIRMAIGAKKKDIMLQFLIESVSLSMVGGIIGILLGLGVYGIIVYFVKWPFIFTPSAVFLAVFFATAVGIFFGYYPAKKASELKPIEALKYE